MRLLNPVAIGFDEAIAIAVVGHGYFGRTTTMAITTTMITPMVTIITTITTTIYGPRICTCSQML